MSETVDKTTISVNAGAQEILTLLLEQKYFRTELGAFLAAAALALALELPISSDPLGGSTKWNRGSGAVSEWEALVRWYLPTNEPVKSLEGYGITGLAHIADRVRNGASFGEIFSD